MNIGLVVPTNHTQHFDTAIGLLGMTKRAGTKQVEITASEYERYVLNKWPWSDRFSSSNAAYSERA